MTTFHRRNRFFDQDYVLNCACGRILINTITMCQCGKIPCNRHHLDTYKESYERNIFEPCSSDEEEFDLRFD